MVWVDGMVIAAEAPGLPVLDQGYLTGMGVFETMRAAAGRAMFLEAHHERLVDGARMFGLKVPEVGVIRGAVEDLLARQGFESARVRVTVSGTGREDGVPFCFGGPARVSVLAFPLKPVRATVLKVATVGVRIDGAGPLAGRKCVSYALHGLAAHEARGHGADEALMLNHRGELCGGAASNIFWVEGGRVWTPDVVCGCRAGVTRGRVIEVCGRLGIPVGLVVAKPGVLAGADEMFLTSSIRGVRRVAMLDGRSIGHAGVTARIREALRRDELRG